MDAKVMVIDTETTGLPPRPWAPVDDNVQWNCCRIVQIAWSIYDVATGELVRSACHIIDPQRSFEIPAVAARIHGITTDIAHARGVPITDVIAHLSSDLDDVGTIVAYNLQFDDNVILSELHRAAVDPDVIAKWCVKNRQCTMKMGTEPKGRWPKLSALYTRLFGKEPDGELHRADTDVRICAECYFRLIK